MVILRQGDRVPEMMIQNVNLVTRVLNIIIHHIHVQHVQGESGYLKIITNRLRVPLPLVRMDHPILYLKGQDLINVHLVKRVLNIMIQRKNVHIVE